jgi:hypothetical protein
LYTDSADLEVYGAAASDHLGRSIASCDVNNDTVGDLIIGAYLDNAGGAAAGAVYVIFGSTGLSGTVELDSDGADFTILGDDDNDRLGRSVACGDVDGDGIADIIAGGYRADQTWGADAGEVYVVYGSGTLSGTLDLDSQSPDVLLRGVATGDEAGFYVASGDINGDNTEDVLIGAYKADVDWPSSETGTAYVVYGSGSLSATMNLSETADVTIYGAAEGDRLSRSLSSGDFNGDNYDDILVGAARADPATGRDNAGISYVIYGASQISSTIYLSDTNQVAIQVLGGDYGDETGRASGTGDLDNDGADDLIIGAVLALSGDAGEAYIIHGGGPFTLSISPTNQTITSGHRITYTVAASDSFRIRDASIKTTFTAESGAGGSWDDNVYTSGISGTWMITATYRGVVTSTTLTVTNDPLPPMPSSFYGTVIITGYTGTDTTDVVVYRDDDNDGEIDGGEPEVARTTISWDIGTTQWVYTIDVPGDQCDEGDDLIFEISKDPVADDDTAAVDEDSAPNAINVLTNDTDGVGIVNTAQIWQEGTHVQNNFSSVTLHGLTISAVTQGSHGSVVTTGGGTGLTYDPTEGDYCGPDSFGYTITDNNSDTDTATVTVTVTCINDAPVVNDQTFSVAENSPSSTSVGTVVASDVENDTLTYTITAGNTNDAFAINASTGQITVNISSELDHETTPSYALTVRVTDDGTPNEFDTATITVDVNDVNEDPTVNDQTFDVNENSVNGTVVDMVVASDPDDGGWWPATPTTATA